VEVGPDLREGVLRRLALEIPQLVDAERAGSDRRTRLRPVSTMGVMEALPPGRER
jgi:hypothetical protein